MRTIDAVRIGPMNVGRDGVLTLKQSKTRGAVYVPWTAPLPAWAQHWAVERALMLSCLRGDGMTFIATQTGKPRSVRGLGMLIATRAREAGIEKSAHGLRKNRLTMVATEEPPDDGGRGRGDDARDHGVGWPQVPQGGRAIHPCRRHAKASRRGRTGTERCKPAAIVCKLFRNSLFFNT